MATEKSGVINKIISIAEQRNMSSRPSIADIQYIADALGVSYGVVSSIWERNGIKHKLNSKRAVKEREKEKKQVEKIRHCIDCGVKLENKNALRCTQCNCIQQAKRSHERYWAKKKEKGVTA